MAEVVAILGGRGMLGTDLATACAGRGYDVRVYDLPDFDITKRECCEQAVSEADVIVNCAAYTNVDGAESQGGLAHRVNAEAVGQLGDAVKRKGTWLLHFSTDFVFDGRLDRPYVETDAPTPINEYGRSKLAGERLLEASGCRHCIVRLEWTYGRHGQNFMTKLVDRARAAGPLRVVDDQVGSPTATTEVARAACDLAAGRAEGLFHFAAAGYVSRYGIAKLVLDRLRLDVELAPCRTSDFSAPAARPLNSRFDCRKIEPLLSAPIAPWQEPLERFLREL